MPGMDGHVVIKAMKAEPRLADIPVIVFTADPGAVRDAAACVLKGSDGPDVLLEAIAACLKA
jgi:CheY-like chemotaxis protein